MKKITAICLTFILVISMAIVPVFASVNQNTTTAFNQTNILRYDKKDKDDDTKKLIEDVIRKFLDSDEYSWAQKSIEKMGFMGILSGTGNGYFQPKNNVTHAEAIAMVLKLTGYKDEAEAIKTEPAYFKGSSDKWSYGYLQLALDKGIIIPSEDGKFNPRTPAKRHEVAKYVVRALGERSLALKNMKTKLTYKDASAVPKDSVGYVYVITKLGIMQGSNNMFQPNSPITRAELAVILDNAESKVIEPSKPSNANEGLFVSYDNTNYKLTLNIDNKNVVYNILPNAPVYKNSTYYGIGALVVGDVIKITVDGQNKIIFIEFVKDSTTAPTTDKLAIETVTYENLPQILKDKVDVLKYTQSFTSFKYNQSIYLIATRGQVPTGGYSIGIKDVYKETVGSSKFNLRAVIEMANPASDAIVTQVISYPYSIIKLNYFNGIDKVNFVNTSNALLAQTVVNTLDITETINGKIDSVDSSNRIIRVLESDNIVRAYYLQNNVAITLNNKSISLSSLKKDMPIVITKVAGMITKLAATNAAEAISGIIDSVGTSNRILTIIESDNVARSYYIPNNVVITLNNNTVSLSSLKKSMPIVITKTNGEITKLAAYNIATETINGKIDSVDAANRIVKVVESDNAVRQYFIPTNVVITLSNVTIPMSSLTKDMPIVITKTNGEITKLAASNIALETKSGKIESVDAANRIIRVLESDNIVRNYVIPTNATVTLNNQAVSLTALTKDMLLVITKTNGTITMVAVTNVAETISGKIDSIDAANRTVKVIESDNLVKSYFIPTNIVITLNNRSVSLSSLMKDMPVVLTRTNGEITKLEATNIIETINGKIDSVGTTSRIVTIIESDNIARSYYIPTNVTITVNSKAALLTDLSKDMPVVLTRTNAVITKLAATNTIEVINGKIDSVDVTNKIVKLLDNNNVVTSYTIPDAAQITLDNQVSDLASLVKGMKVAVTKSNGLITKLAVQRDIQSIEGVLVTVYTSQNKKYISVKVGTAINAYEITSATKVYYNNESSTIESIPLNSTLIIKIENAETVEVRNK